jgi:hypothetical protein
VHAYNTSNLGGVDGEDSGSRPARGQKIVRPNLNKQVTHGGSMRLLLATCEE